MLNKFQIKDCNPVGTPVETGVKLVKDPREKRVDSTFYKQIVGRLMYLSGINEKPYIMHVINLISRYMECLMEMHLSAAKRILRYLKGTTDFGIMYMNGENQNYLALQIETMLGFR